MLSASHLSISFTSDKHLYSEYFGKSSITRSLDKIFIILFFFLLSDIFVLLLIENDAIRVSWELTFLYPQIYFFSSLCILWYYLLNRCKNKILEKGFPFRTLFLEMMVALETFTIQMLLLKMYISNSIFFILNSIILVKEVVGMSTLYIF